MPLSFRGASSDQILRTASTRVRIRPDPTADFVHTNTLGYRLMRESIDPKPFEKPR